MRVERRRGGYSGIRNAASYSLLSVKLGCSTFLFKLFTSVIATTFSSDVQSPHTRMIVLLIAITEFPTPLTQNNI